jgi:zinc transporter, ZIP family
MDTRIRQPDTAGDPWKTLALFLLPLVLLALVIVAFLSTGGAGLQVESAAPIEALSFERTVLRPHFIELTVRNTGPQELTIAQVSIRDAFIPFTASPGRAMRRLGRAVISIPYPWVKGEAYDIRLFSGNSIPFHTAIMAATETKILGAATFAGFTLIGIYVGVLPVFLGIFWYPVLRRLGKRAFLWLMALTIGLLIFLGIDAVKEALDTASVLGGPFQGAGLIGIGIVATVMLLYSIARRQSGEGTDETTQRTRISLMISIGIGLHNLGEGLAIGASFSIGAAALGTFLVIGFILQNITEGLGIIAPIVRQRPSARLLLALGLIGGAPAIVGAWVGGLVYSQVLAVLFLAIGAGAVFEVAYEIVGLLRRDSQSRLMPLTITSGVVSGMLVLYVTGLLIK